MSTRATYEINGYTFYVHYDGYKKGSAVYFWKMLDNDHKGGYAERFLAGNDQAELTPSHDAHGDTEFRYTLTGNKLSVSARKWVGDDVEWNDAGTYELAEFINKYADEMQDGEDIIELSDRAVIRKKLELQLLDDIQGLERMKNNGYFGNAQYVAKYIVRHYSEVCKTGLAKTLVDRAAHIHAELLPKNCIDTHAEKAAD